MLSSRPIRSIIIALLVLLGGSAGVDAAVASSATPVETRIVEARRSEASDEQLFVDKINALRTSLGLEPLRIDPMLVPLARDWAAHLRSQGALSHASDLSVGVTADWSRLGENVGVGPANQVQALFDAFVNSPAHYANLVKPDYRSIGVGVVYGDDGRIWTAHRFMAVASGGTAATSSTTLPAPTTLSPATAPTPTTATPRRTTSPTTAPTTTAPTTTAPPSTAPLDAAADPEATPTPPPARPSVAPALVERIAADLAAAGL